MTDHKFQDDSILHAYIDGELDKAAKSNLLIELEDNDALRNRICELRHIKEWVQFSFEDLTAPSQSPTGKQLNQIPMARFAASILILLGTFSAGWYGHMTQTTLSDTTNELVSNESNHVILHIGQSDQIKFNALLDKADNILQQYSELGTQVEVLANAGGLGMLQSSPSPHAKRIQLMMEKYDNVRFIACSKGLQKLREKGFNPILVKGVLSDSTAGDHVIQRLQDGWTYITI